MEIKMRKANNGFKVQKMKGIHRRRVDEISLYGELTA
jgi:hypothetical protein